MPQLRMRGNVGGGRCREKKKGREGELVIRKKNRLDEVDSRRGRQAQNQQ